MGTADVSPESSATPSPIRVTWGSMSSLISRTVAELTTDSPPMALPTPSTRTTDGGAGTSSNTALEAYVESPRNITLAQVLVASASPAAKDLRSDFPMPAMQTGVEVVTVASGNIIVAESEVSASPASHAPDCEGVVPGSVSRLAAAFMSFNSALAAASIEFYPRNEGADSTASTTQQVPAPAELAGFSDAAVAATLDMGGYMVESMIRSQQESIDTACIIKLADADFAAIAASMDMGGYMVESMVNVDQEEQEKISELPRASTSASSAISYSPLCDGRRESVDAKPRHDQVGVFFSFCLQEEIFPGHARLESWQHLEIVVPTSSLFQS